jgi:serine/threonine-protein kinase
MTPGAILAGKYRLLSLLGRGGMGSVWRAERLDWESLVAIKLMNLSLSGNPQALDRFRREARSAASLRSLHVVQILDDGVDDATGAPFIVMELLEGESLAERLARVGRLGPIETARVVRHIARALGRAHDAGMIHRDLKPDNIFLVQNDDEEVAKVLDFGIAKWTATTHKLAHPTLTGHVLGTLAYMSPEQVKGTMDQRADLWSLAVIACECLTGARPFQAENFVSLAVAICSGQAPLPSSLGPVPRGFDAWFARAVARDLDKRFGSARSMADELCDLCGLARPFSLPAPVRPSLHTTAEPTEAEPVLELSRRIVRPASSPAELVSSVLPLYHTQSEQLSARRSRRPLVAAALGLAVACGAGLWLWRLAPGELDQSGRWLSSLGAWRSSPASASVGPESAARGSAAPALPPPMPAAAEPQLAPSATTSDARVGELPQAEPGASEPGPSRDAGALPGQRHVQRLK